MALSDYGYYEDMGNTLIPWAKFGQEERKPWDYGGLLAAELPWLMRPDDTYSRWTAERENALANSVNGMGDVGFSPGGQWQDYLADARRLYRPTSGYYTEGDSGILRDSYTGQELTDAMLDARWREGLPEGAADVVADPVNGVAWLVDSEGKIIPGSDKSLRTNDDAAYYAGMLAMMGAGYAGMNAGIGNTGGWQGTMEGWGSGAAGTAPAGGMGAPIAGAPASGRSGDPSQTDPGPGPDYKPSETQPPSPSPSSGTPPVTPPTDSGNKSGDTNYLDDFQKWMKDNPFLARMGSGGLLALLSQLDKDKGPAPYTGPMPTVSRGTWAPTAQANLAPAQASYGLLNLPRQGNPYSGLLNYLGGK